MGKEIQRNIWDEMKGISYTAEEVDKLAKNEIQKKDILKEH